MPGIVAIVGRPNVGKSTLFNRLVGRRDAIVDDHSGVTRDRQYAQAEWLNHSFTVIDTGGYVTHSDDIFEKEIRKQVELAMNEADVLLFMADVNTGITDLDQEFADIIRKTNKPALMVVNKVDNDDRLFESGEFYSLGIPELFTVSSISGSGTGELLDRTVELLPDETSAEDEDELPKIAIVGRPNVGKSSLCNVLLGEERNMVTDIPGTTRDSINTIYNVYGKTFELIDTAGIRRKSKVSENIEFYSVMRSIRSIENCDVCVIMIDATRGMESQDMNLFRLAQKHGKGIVILVNKWDLVEKDTHSTKQFTAAIHERIAPFVDVPILYISALTKQRVFKAVEIMIEVYESLSTRITTNKLNEFLLPIIEQRPPPAKKGKYIKIKYITQLPSKKVCFAFFCNLPQYVGDGYKRFLENKMREEFELTGIPIMLFFRKK